MFKNVASQKVIVYAHDTDADAPKTGDANNITAYIAQDAGSIAVSDDTHPTELDATNMKGLYVFNLTKGETNGNVVSLSAVSSTGNVTLDPVIIHTILETDLVLVRTTIAVLSSQTSFTLSAGSANNNAYNGCVLIVEDASTSAQKAVGLVLDYVGGDKTITLAIDPGIFTMEATDIVTILATATAANVWDRILTGATHNIPVSAGRRLRGVQAFGDYANAALWFDSENGVGGTTEYENATVQNPSNSIADILTLATSLKMVRIEVAPVSTLTLGAALEGFNVHGSNWTLDLSGESVSGSVFFGAKVSGVCSGAIAPGFIDCHLENVTLPPFHLTACGLGGTITAASAGTFYFDFCHSMVAGTSTPTFDFGSGLNSSNVNFRGYSGGIQIQYMGAGAGNYNMSLEGNGQLIINANCSETSLIAIRGNFTVTDNASGRVTLSDEARFDQAQVLDALTDDATQIDGTQLNTHTAITPATVGAAMTLTAAYNAAKTAAAPGAAMTLTAGAVQAIWNALTSALTTVGSIGKLLVTNINATISSRSSHSAANVTGGTTVAAAEDNIRGADSDTLKTLSDQLDSTGGAGAIKFTYTLTNIADGLVIADAAIWVTTNIDGSNIIASGSTDQNGKIVFYLDAGTVYVWRQKSGWNFDNPDTEVVA